MEDTAPALKREQELHLKSQIPEKAVGRAENMQHGPAGKSGHILKKLLMFIF